MAISDNLTSFSANFSKLPQQKIAQAISFLLIVYIAFLAAKITWLFVPQNILTYTSAVGVKQVSSKGQNINLSAVQALNLFGQYNKPTKEVTKPVRDVPKTRLKLTLSGLVASDVAESAAAIIAHKGKQETYGIGDVILGTRASLEQVLTDRVIIKQLGRLETLMLDGADYKQPTQNIAPKKVSNQKVRNKAKVVDQRLNDELTKSAALLRSSIAKDPGKITDYLRISPTRKSGKIIGYRLSPGKTPEFFKLSGIKSGDIAIQMNGYDLRAPLEAAKALGELKTARDISLLVERKSDLIEILFSID